MTRTQLLIGLAIALLLLGYFAASDPNGNEARAELALASAPESKDAYAKSAPSLTKASAPEIAPVATQVVPEAAPERALVGQTPKLLDVEVHVRRWGALGSAPSLPGVRFSLLPTSSPPVPKAGPRKFEFESAELGAISVDGDSVFIDGVKISGTKRLEPLVATPPPRLELTTNSQGVVPLQLPWPEQWKNKETPKYLPPIELIAPAHLSLVNTRYAKRLVDGESTLQLYIYVTTSVTGYVQDALGRPLAAEVLLYGQRENGLWWQRRKTKSDHEGYFEFATGREGLFQIVARAPSYARPAKIDRLLEAGPITNAGTGVSAPFPVTFSGPSPVSQIVVAGQGVLRGRVIDNEGHPVARVAVAALLGEYDRDDFTDRTMGKRQSVDTRMIMESLYGGGLLGGSAITTEDGAFAFVGLRPGSYVVRAKPPGEDTYSKVLSLAPIPSNGEPFTLEYTHPNVVLSLLDPAGAALPATWPRDYPSIRKPSIFAASGGSGDASLRQMLRERGLRLKVLPVGETYAEDPTKLRVQACEIEYKPLGEAQYAFPVEAGKSYTIGLEGAGIDWKRIQVDIPLGAGRVNVDLLVDLTKLD